jgi:hypothetical protein
MREFWNLYVIQQEVLGRTTRLLSSDTTQAAQKTRKNLKGDIQTARRSHKPHMPKNLRRNIDRRRDRSYYTPKKLGRNTDKETDKLSHKPQKLDEGYTYINLISYKRSGKN